MENIKFIDGIMQHSKRHTTGVIAGNAILYQMDNGNIAKCYCESNGVVVFIINKKEGEVDRSRFPFANYFKPKQCSPNAPKWNQTIENGKWYFSQYAHCLPTVEDFRSIASAVDRYIDLMD